MKCAVFVNGLLCVAFAAPEQVQHGELDRLPLPVPTEAPKHTHSASLAALVPVRRPRPSGGVFIAGGHAVTDSRVKCGPKAEPLLYPRTARLLSNTQEPTFQRLVPLLCDADGPFIDPQQQ